MIRMTEITYIAMQHKDFRNYLSLKVIAMKTLFPALLVLASIGCAHADGSVDESTRRLVGTCVVLESARLDDGSKSLDVISKAVSAGCMPVLRTALARGTTTHPVNIGQSFVADSTTDDFAIAIVLEDMAAGAINWLRIEGKQQAAQFRPAVYAAR